jgi:phosphomannomutase
MTLIKSISGIRGTIGGNSKENLTPIDIVEISAAYGHWIIATQRNKKVVVGRDGRISGQMVLDLVVNTLMGCGIDVVDLGLSTTPTVEIAVPLENAGGGIIITASHNPEQWNALKLLNEKGEFVSSADGEKILEIADNAHFNFAEVQNLGKRIENKDYIKKHIDKILALELVDVESIKNKNYTVVVDGVNSSGSIFVPELLNSLGIENIVVLNPEPNGKFNHNPEPLPENLKDLMEAVVTHKAILGIAIDPDVDRLAFVSEDGSYFGEEYTLVSIADYYLKNKGGNTVSNLSSTKALKDITLKAGYTYEASAVGEVNVVNKMKETNAIIGGEGNGGIILPELHYGRDALVGIALFISQLAKLDTKPSELRSSYPNYFISKNKIELGANTNMSEILSKIEERYKDYDCNTVDGLKINFENEWVHLRKSNTEPIIRIYSESSSMEAANLLAEKIKKEINSLI